MEVRFAEIHNTLEIAFSVFETLPFESIEDYKQYISTTLWKLGFPNACEVMGTEEAEEFLMLYFEDFCGTRPIPYKKWEVTLH